MGAEALSRVGRAAAWYARRGLRVHPLRAGSKLPILEGWQHRATIDEATINIWWTQWPDAGVGIATGADSGVVVVDTDPRHDGDESLRDLEREHGKLPDTWRSLTANGGTHTFLGHPGGRVPNSASAIGAGIDVRGDGGYVVAPPTELEGGRGYGWEIGYGPHEVPVAPMPLWLRNVATGRKATGEERPPRPASEWARMIERPIAKDHRHPTLKSLAAMLAARSVPYDVGRELLLGFNARNCKPPKPEEEVRKVVLWAWGKELGRGEL